MGNAPLVCRARWHHWVAPLFWFSVECESPSDMDPPVGILFFLWSQLQLAVKRCVAAVSFTCKRGSSHATGLNTVGESNLWNPTLLAVAYCESGLCAQCPRCLGFMVEHTTAYHFLHFSFTIFPTIIVCFLPWIHPWMRMLSCSAFWLCRKKKKRTWCIRLLKETRDEEGYTMVVRDKRSINEEKHFKRDIELILSIQCRLMWKLSAEQSFVWHWVCRVHIKIELCADVAGGCLPWCFEPARTSADKIWLDPELPPWMTDISRHRSFVEKELVAFCYQWQLYKSLLYSSWRYYNKEL